MVLHTLGRQRQVDFSDFQASGLYTVKLCQKKKRTINQRETNKVVISLYIYT